MTFTTQEYIESIMADINSGIHLVMVQYIVYRDYRDKPFRDNYITKAIS